MLAGLVRRFGSDVLAADGSLDRAALRAKVMGDQAALDALNAIVHPAVQRRREQLLREAGERGDVLVVNDIPLLFEVLDPASFDAVVLVAAPVATRQARLRAARGLSSEEADRMIAAQMPAERKRSRSHHVIENGGTLAALEARASAVFERLRRSAAAAALGRPARSLLLVETGATQASERAALDAITARYQDAGLAVRRVVGAGGVKQPWADRRERPDGVVATMAAGPDVQAAWEHAGRPGVLAPLSDDPAPVAVRLDLRPWGHDRLTLAEPDATGLAPRPDLFPPHNPLG